MGVYTVLSQRLRYKWQQLRVEHLRREPYCRMCRIDLNILVPAKNVDHIIPHRGDETLLLDRNNLQTLCDPHHNSAKQREESQGFSTGCDVDGSPIDPRHPWNKGKR